MTLRELKSELDRKMIDIKEKIRELEGLVKEQDVDKSELKDVLDELRKLQKDIVGQYNQLDSLKAEEKERFERLEKNVYTNLETFDEAFLKAGSMVKQSKFASRDRSVDFKNPPGTK